MASPRKARLLISASVVVVVLMFGGAVFSQSRDAEDRDFRFGNADRGRSMDERPILDSNTDPAGAIGITLQIDKPYVKAGDTIAVTAVADRECFLRILGFSAAGDVIQLWPNRSTDWNGRVRADVPVQVPSRGDTFKIEVDGTRPVERIIAVATTKEGSLLGDNDFRKHEDSGLATYAGKTRELVNEIQRRIDRLPRSVGWGTAQASVRVASTGAAPEAGDVEDVVVEMRVSRQQVPTNILSKAAGFGVPTFRLDTAYEPVPLPAQDSKTARSLDQANEEVVIVRGQVDRNKKAELESQPGVVKVWRDTPIEFIQQRPCPIAPCDCTPNKATGTMMDVVGALGVDKLWEAGYKGKGVAVGIVDNGITAEGRYTGPKRKIPRVIGGWPTDWGTKTGEHGNMCAVDVQGMAPEADLYDLRPTGGKSFKEHLSVMVAAYEWALKEHKRTGKPHILSNSWGMFQEAWDPEYGKNPNHFFTKKFLQAIDDGIIVLFAAGNCGQTCPDQRCGSDNGPGRSIWGVSGHPRCMTVGAVNVRGEWIGYSSQGPATFHKEKPDFCAISHFKGYHPCDNGTSAACPIAAGVVALLKQANPRMTQDEVRKMLIATAKDIGPQGWDEHSGYGIIRPFEVLKKMKAGQSWYQNR